ncbi:hypothetical protein [Kineosporia sp. NBRC 101731]|uniref:hypothetical protein n=1 Tax=Kineosporia sp. NBRC 101731 TaxID=3032199 RepID=UPI0024A565D2|nr:hypothetical protein [Kineosporia sp. NBRC 101731]GLY29480.1 hypothetical protein Kisp02_28450 [Kineosporia sp. NBRC 101731]
MSAPAPGWLARQLPVVMQQDDFTVRFLAIFEDLADTLLHSVGSVAEAADPTVAPAPMVPWLGSWIAGPVDPAAGTHPLRDRDWLRAQSRALGARGTRAGLEQWLSLLSGGRPVEIIDGGGVYREGQAPEGATGWVQVRMPLAGDVDAQQVVALIEDEVPIGVRVELLVIPDEPSGVPRPRDAQDDADHTDHTADADLREPMPGGPYFWDGGDEDVFPPLWEEAIPAPEVTENTQEAPLSGALRRLPGTGGRAVRAGRLCPECAEPNAFGSLTCLRCASVLRVPRPVAEPVPEPEPEPLWDDEDWLPQRRTRPVVVATAGLLLLLSLILFLTYLLR